MSTVIARTVSRINNELKAATVAHRIRSLSAKVVVLYPFIIVFLFSLLLVLPPTRGTALSMLKENHVVELLTFGFLLIGGLGGLTLAWQTRNHRQKRFVLGFYVALSAGLLFVAMEEIAWGQQFLGFETPPAMTGVNAQGEVTVHNVWPLQGRAEFFHLAFGFGGLLGVLLSFRGYLQRIETSSLLLSWFLVIICVSSVNLYTDYFPVPWEFDRGMRYLSEVVEMLIAISGLLFVWFNARRMSVRSRG